MGAAKEGHRFGFVSFRSLEEGEQTHVLALRGFYFITIIIIIILCRVVAFVFFLKAFFFP